MRILIVEDEPAAVRHLCRLVSLCDSSAIVIESLDSVDTTIKWLNTHTPPDLIFMDIQLADGINFEIFQHIEVTIPIIFCTAYDEYAIDAFKVNSIDYLLKPLEKDAVCRSLLKFRKLQFSTTQPLIDYNSFLKQFSHFNLQQSHRMLVKTGKNYVSIPCDEIACIYIEFRIVTLVTLAGKNYTLDRPLDELEAILDKSVFFRVNRQAIVSISGISRVEADDGRLNIYLTTSNTKPIIVSRDKSTLFKNWLGN